ncbi:alpha/beta hydrolase [Spirochaeta cellobiosiphila]|uniref:alpha/beta hydrolase n=1 Tax=Spirochaeta cellobiosiphila TaxID=504483 RepID=UPI00042941BB|nr:alpha/beta hydrolase [Spirochaeta cellobiosiphila]
MNIKSVEISNIPALIYGDSADKIFIFVHGRYSNKESAESFSEIVTKNGYQVLSFDLPEHGERKNEEYSCNLKNGVHDLKIIYDSIKEKYKELSLFACSLGAYFSLVAYSEILFKKCLFLSPILNMERLIQNMMKWSNINEEKLEEEKEIDTSFGEKLSWEYYNYVKEHPIKKWNSPTSILYGESDNLTEIDILNTFAKKYDCHVEIMKNGEHYFHTPEQLKFLNSWITKQKYE